MANHYRISGPLRWASQSGNALWTLTNTSATHKLTVKGIEVHQRIRRLPTSTNPQSVAVSLCRITGWAGYTTLTPMKLDTAASALPTDTYIGYGGGYSSISTILPVRVYKQALMSGALNNLARQTAHGRVGTCQQKFHAFGPSCSADLEAITLADGEAVGLVVTDVQRGIPLVVTVTVRDDDSGNLHRTTHVVGAWQDNQVLWGVAHDSGAGNTSLRIVSIEVQELGDTTTPFFQVVSCTPRSDVGDTTNQPDVFKFDTAADAFSTYGRFLQDVALLPGSGIPEVALSDASAGAPKGVSYLHTKDFQGPTFAVLFPEHDVGGPGLAPDSGVAFTRRGCKRIVDHIAPIVVRPGETIGMVTSAELATGTTAVALSGWMPFDVAVDVDADFEVTPTIEFTGLETGTVVALVETGTETLVLMISESGGVATYTHDTTGPDLDARILAPGFVFQQIDGIEQTTGVQTFAVQQVADEIYDSGWVEPVTISGSTHRINIDAGNTSISVPYVYSAWVDWALTGDNLQYYHAFENQGGTVIDPGEGTYIPAYCYLVNSWRVKPSEADHTLSVKSGVLLVSGGGDPFVDTTGAYTVRVNYQQPVQAITVSTGGVTPADVADAVWDEAALDHTADGTFGHAVQTKRGKIV